MAFDLIGTVVAVATPGEPDGILTKGFSPAPLRGGTGRPWRALLVNRNAHTRGRAWLSSGFRGPTPGITELPCSNLVLH